MKSHASSPAMRGFFRQAGASEKAVLLLATWFGVGFLPVAPGTLATLAGAPLVLLMSRLGGFAAAICLAGVLLVALLTSHRACRLVQQDDPPEIVVDEVAGFLVTLFLIPFSWLTLSLGFVLFRVFDIWKPFPVDRAERITGGAGILLDDIVAGVYANLALRGILQVVG